MSRDWVADVTEMHDKFGFHEIVENMDTEKLRRLLDFRMSFMEEEHRELTDAHAAGDAEGIIDALIDTCVVAIGTLDLFGVNVNEAWNRVHAANMSKERGVKPNRPNPLGLPDLMKPPGWVAPTHDAPAALSTASAREERQPTDSVDFGFDG